MSDVREQLLGVVVGNLRERQGGDSQSLTNAILERFEVTPKPVVTDFKLGAMVAGTSTGLGYLTARECVEMGRKLRHQLRSAGLTIVRIEQALAGPGGAGEGAEL